MLEQIPITLKQKSLSEIREFTLEPNRIRVHVKNINGDNEFFVGYDAITTTTRTVTQQNGRIYLLAIFWGLFALLGLIIELTQMVDLRGVSVLFALASIMFFGLHLFQKRRYFVVDLVNKHSLLFIANKPTPEQLADFIKSLYQARRDFYRKKYYVINPEEDPNEQLGRLKWLLTLEIISEAEFQTMKTSLDGSRKKDNADFKSNGFLN